MKQQRNSFQPLLQAGLLAVCALSTIGCRSRFVDTTIVNQGPEIHVVEFDYPSASFGTDKLAAGGQFHYRFQIQGSGPLSLQFEDLAGKSHKVDGPNVDQGQEGSLIVSIDAHNQVNWKPQLSAVR